MKYYTYKGLDGTVAIVKGKTKSHAAEVLTNEMRRWKRLPARAPGPDQMFLWPQGGEQVRFLT